ncbi:Uncharacterised protein [Vibrio cholerae]|nr:Uncharacterised protein [Vibrio cholerae]CSC77858.1 Uncharacterised protein [Vibrio cholerae]CSI54663.1 Uncharacterised protein [Vibrio cholerae]
MTEVLLHLLRRIGQGSQFVVTNRGAIHRLRQIAFGNRIRLLHHNRQRTAD